MLPSIVAWLLGTPVLCSQLASAARACGSSNSTSSYAWRISDARYDGPGPASNGKAVVAVSITPNGTSSFFECVAEWPESWAGWSGTGTNGDIVWSDCIWSGAGPTYDTAISSALDWKSRTMYLTHTFPCSDKQGTIALATGSSELDLSCASDEEDNSTYCALKTDTASPSPLVKTTPKMTRLATDAPCTENEKVYQSWQLESWRRSYRLTPGNVDAPPADDTGPSFTLNNLANGGVFECAPAGNATGSVFSGSCRHATGASPAMNDTAASFEFDPGLDVLTIHQTWECSASSSFGVTGVGFVQATCDRQGEILTCTSLPFWIGTKPV
ncbi:hypothetical protein F5Y17DRAFT_475263 [Xylariaceae sp. FL0594]|nr:hypothetical protein F5Y17DRAFT_475263 [Xylariaceae sp. FL0594]